MLFLGKTITRFVFRPSFKVGCSQSHSANWGHPGLRRDFSPAPTHLGPDPEAQILVKEGEHPWSCWSPGTPCSSSSQPPLRSASELPVAEFLPVPPRTQRCFQKLLVFLNTTSLSIYTFICYMNYESAPFRSKANRMEVLVHPTLTVERHKTGLPEALTCTINATP